MNTKKIVHDALILTAFTLVLGFLLGAVHEITADRIEASELAAEQAAYKDVFEDGYSFIDYGAVDLEEANAEVAAAGYNDEIIAIKQALDANNELLGYVFNVTAKDGSQGSITFSVGIEADGTVMGFSITDISETPGLGDKAKTDEFNDQFENKDVENFSVVKDGGSADEEILAITGATITSRAMTEGVNSALLVYNWMPR